MDNATNYETTKSTCERAAMWQSSVKNVAQVTKDGWKLQIPLTKAPAFLSQHGSPRLELGAYEKMQRKTRNMTITDTSEWPR